MLPQVLRKVRLDPFIQFLAGQYRVVGPVAKNVPAADTGRYAFEEILDPADLCLDHPITMQGPKKWLLPPVETILSYERQNGRFRAAAPIDAEPTAIVGLHPCDVASLWMLDAAFEADPGDPYYLARRERTLLIAVDCAEPCDEHAFCKDMRSLHVREGYDIMFADIGESYFVDVASARGRKIVQECGLFSPASPDEHHARLQFIERQDASFPNLIPFDTRYLPELLGQSYDSLLWEAAARDCFSCGSCTLVCPTCYCFDIADDADLDQSRGRRERRWDSCMLKVFAMVAGGENFREHRSSRLRHRIMRKGKYLFEKFGKPGCVGCGRCERNCTAGICTRKLFHQLGLQAAPHPSA